VRYEAKGYDCEPLIDCPLPTTGKKNKKGKGKKNLDAIVLPRAETEELFSTPKEGNTERGTAESPGDEFGLNRDPWQFWGASKRSPRTSF
jgi:hypothetical protein